MVDASCFDFLKTEIECCLEFVISILQCMTLCSHYLLQNFILTAVFSLCDNTWGIHSLMLRVFVL